MDRGTFTQHFPEFRDTDSRLVDAKLATAAAKMGGPDASVWGGFAPSGQPVTLADIAQGFLAAHLLASSPFGTQFKQSDDGTKKTPYMTEYEALLESVAGGFAVAGGGSLVGPGTAPAPPPTVAFVAGIGTASVTNGSTAVTFTAAQTLPAGTLLVFGSQTGGYYSVAIAVSGQTSATLAAPYTGTTNTATTWSHT